MSRFQRLALSSGITFGTIMGVFWAVLYPTRPIAFAIVMAILSGVLFGVTIAAFITSRHVQAITRPQFLAGENIIIDNPANHFKRWESVGGWLFLTNQRLVFKSHPYNIQRHELSLPLASIATVEISRLLLFIPNGLLIITTTGERHRFVVSPARAWQEHVQRVLANTTESESEHFHAES